MKSRETETVALLLDQGRVPRDGVLVVHAAFKGLSQAGYGVEAFVEALLERLKGGTVVMPAMCWRTVTPAQPNWDELATESHVGVLAELFRTRYAEGRSIHPTHSATARGPATGVLLDGHHLDDTPCSVNSPWGRLAEMDAHILLLGIGFECCTALHHPEEMAAPDLYLHPPAWVELYNCTARDGTRYCVRLRRHLRLIRDFPQYELRLMAKGRLAQGELSGTRWHLVSARDLMADAFANLHARANAHILSSP